MKQKRRPQRQTLSAEEAAHEIYAVFMQRQKASRVLPKDYLIGRLSSQDVYSYFLKLCLEYDYSEDLTNLRRGLLFVVKTLGPGQIAKVAKINRVTLYRMLSKGGNPTLKNLMSLLRTLNMGLWVVDKEFYNHREQVRRRSKINIRH